MSQPVAPLGFIVLAASAPGSWGQFAGQMTTLRQFPHLFTSRQDSSQSATDHSKQRHDVLEEYSLTLRSESVPIALATVAYLALGP